MKKLLNRSFVYMLLALAAGVFYRELTKWSGFTGRTTLAFLHPHLLLLGALLLLALIPFARLWPLEEEKHFGLFLTLHTLALPWMTGMMLARGVAQVKGLVLPKGVDAALSGLAGLGHILMAVALVVLYSALRRVLTQREQA